MTELTSALNQPEDATYNQRGELSPRQREQWQKQRNAAVGGGVLNLFFAGLFGVGVMLALNANRTAGGEGLIWVLVLGGGAGILMLGLGGQQLWQALVLHQDLTVGQVLEAEGTVVWQGNNYRVDYPGRPTWAERNVGLPPGHYRLFYLPRSGRVAGAVAMAGSPPVTQILTDILAQALGYPAEALAENRAGRLHPQQTSKLQRSTIMEMIFAAVLGLPLLGGGVVLTLTSLESVFPASLMLSLLGAVFLGALGWPALMRWQDVTQGTVTIVTGPVTKYLRHSRNSTSYYYKVNNLSLSVGENAYNALLPGEYRVYYLARCKQVVGAEPV